MKILILTQYFPPETGAPQNRLYELAVRLKKKGAEVTVMTAMPNYPQMRIYEGYRGKLYHYEENQGVKIHRSWIFVSRNRSIFSRLLNYFSFVFTSFSVACLKIKKQDYILCESPPLFLGISAYLLKKIKGAKLIFNVSDLWPESAEKLGLISNKFLLKISTSLEEFLYKKSELITGQTQGICNNISSRFPKKKVHWFPNGVDLSLYSPLPSSWRKENNFNENDFILLYAGIIGYAQGLDVILNAANFLKENHSIKFILLGDGPEKDRLMKLKADLRLNNVHFLDSIPKSEMPEILNSIDASIIPLKKLELFKGAIPSKIFETLAVEKPILLGVEGEAKSLFIDQGTCGLAYTPEDGQMLSEKILDLYNSEMLRSKLGKNGRTFVEQYFNRDEIVDNLWKVIQPG